MDTGPGTLLSGAPRRISEKRNGGDVTFCASDRDRAHQSLLASERPAQETAWVSVCLRVPPCQDHQRARPLSIRSCYAAPLCTGVVCPRYDDAERCLTHRNRFLARPGCPPRPVKSGLSCWGVLGGGFCRPCSRNEASSGLERCVKGLNVGVWDPPGPLLRADPDNREGTFLPTPVLRGGSDPGWGPGLSARLPQGRASMTGASWAW